MNATTTCPGPVCLKEYLLGRMSEATAADVERHLASCPECRKRLPTIRAEDDFVADFRARAGRPQPENALLDRLAGHLHGLFHNLPASRDATPAADREATPAPASPAVEDAVRSKTLPHPPRPKGQGQPLTEEVADDVGALLAPPREPGELGWLGDYRVLDKLGSGGMGVVFLAEDTRLRRRVALKVMKPALAANPLARQRFLREAQLMASLSHDHVVAIHQVGEDNGVPFLAMPLLQGETLDSRLKREGRLPLPEVLRIGLEAAEGLAAAHERGLIHRDVKPANLWLEARPGGRSRVKVLDFGLARAGDSDVQLTQLGAILGTPAYMAPEQAGGRVDHRADLFSLGCVFYRMTAGQAPFEGEAPLEVLLKVAMAQPRPPRELNPETPPALSDLILRLLAKDPAQRPQSAGEVIQAVQAIQRAPPPEVRPGLVPAPLPFSSEATVTAAQSLRPAPNPRDRRRWHAFGRRSIALAGMMAMVVVAVVIIIRDRNGNKVAEVNVPDDHIIEIVIGGNKGDSAFVQQVAALPADKQVEAVAKKLQELNPGFDGKVTPTIEGGVVTGLEFLTDHVTDISPVRALVGLKALRCGSSDFSNGKLFDLSPLKDMKLTFLSCAYTRVSDLSPLKDMKLTGLACDSTPVSDLSPLKDMKLTSLACDDTPVSDLSPLEGMPLTSLMCSDTRVSDLSPLKYMNLTFLYCGRTSVSDLSPLKEMPLKYLNCDFKPERDTEILRSLKTLEQINGQPAAEFWKGVDDKANQAVPVLLGKQFTNSVGMKLMRIESGEFLMGAPDSDEQADANEKPQHRVRITRPFYLGVYEVTQDQYARVMDDHPSSDASGDDAGRRPVENVAWEDAAEFCRRLSEKDGRKYRLPTEAEWEYACRDGTTTAYPFGDDPAGLGDYDWVGENSGDRTHPVGLKKANPWGLYDMGGNVREWCADRFARYHVEQQAQAEAVDPDGGHVVRGGDHHFSSKNARAASRFSIQGRHPNIGFRVALDPDKVHLTDK